MELSYFVLTYSEGFKMGLLSSLFGGDDDYPEYSTEDAIKSQNFGVVSPFGNLSLKQNADGTWSKVYEQSANDATRNNLIGQGLGTLSLDPTATQQAYYNQATNLLNKQFGQQQENLDRQLINRGIQTGTEQYNRAMGNLTDSQNATLQNLANQAVYMGQSNLGQQIGNINALAGSRDILALPTMGGATGANYDSFYNSQLNAYNQNQNRASNIGGTIGALIGGLF